MRTADKRIPMRIFEIDTTGRSYTIYWDDTSIDDLHEMVITRPFMLVKTIEGREVMIYTYHITAITPIGGIQNRDIDGLKKNAQADVDAATDSIGGDSVEDGGEKVINKKLH